MTEALFGGVTRDAVISACKTYRYHLTRRWAPPDEGDTVGFVMLNPSTADGSVDDRTLEKCTAYARSWGYGALEVYNLFALRSTEPAALRTHADPVGPENDSWLSLATTRCALLVCAWGADSIVHGRAPGVLSRLMGTPGAARLAYLKLSGEGHPCHPLYLPGNLRPIVWLAPRAPGGHVPTAPAVQATRVCGAPIRGTVPAPAAPAPVDTTPMPKGPPRARPLTRGPTVRKVMASIDDQRTAGRPDFIHAEPCGCRVRMLAASGFHTSEFVACPEHSGGPEQREERDAISDRARAAYRASVQPGGPEVAP